MYEFPALPITYDLISHLMLAGIIQSIFLGLTLLVKARRSNQVLLLWGIFILATGIISLDLYLCYTGLMQHVLYLNDSTEFLALLTAPLLFLATRRILIKKNLQWNITWPHFIAPGLYFLNMYFFWKQPIAAKYNSYIDAYFPDLEHLTVTTIGSEDPLMIKSNIDWWILASFIIYLILSVRLFRDKNQLEGTKTTQSQYNKHELIKNTLIGVGIFLVIFIIVESANDRDAGDYIISIIITLQSFALSYFVISNSKMLDQQWLADKYDTSGINKAHASQLYQRLVTYVKSEGFKTTPGENQEKIAAHLKTSKSYLSQAITQSEFKNFNDFINHYRVRLAKEALRAPDNKNFTIESIGMQVGFGSKSAFYTAFKKEVGVTPAAYAKAT